MRTKGSGWGNGSVVNWQICPRCNKKKMYCRSTTICGLPNYYWCTKCKKGIDEIKFNRSTQQYEFDGVVYSTDSYR